MVVLLIVVELLCQDLFSNPDCVLLAGGLCPPLSEQCKRK
jgi:hypothetical protein